MPQILTGAPPRPAPRRNATDTDAVLAATAGFEAMLSIALGLVQAGRRIDLAGLEQEAARLCAAALVCPEASYPALRAALLPLLPRVAALRAAIRPA